MMRRPDNRAPVSRLVPDVPLPPYSYVPGRFPHPLRDPAGHSYREPTPHPPAIDAQTWQQSHTYLLGCDLFNHGYYWEAHEAWEAVWNACGRRGTAADFLKGLIKLAAAGVKAREGRPAGVRRHAARAAELFRGVREAVGRAKYLGLDVAALIAFAERVAEGVEVPSAANVGRDDAKVEIVFALGLWPLD